MLVDRSKYSYNMLINSTSYDYLTFWCHISINETENGHQEKIGT